MHLGTFGTLTSIDLNMEMGTAEIRRFARKHEERLPHHDNVEAIQLLDNSESLRRLKRTKPNTKPRT
jgi:hypothetical protein